MKTTLILLSVLFHILANIGRAGQPATIIVTEFNGSRTTGPTLQSSLRLQEAYNRTLFTQGPIWITGVGFRNTPQAFPSYAAEVGRIQFTLSTATNWILSGDFASNLGADSMIVFDGPLSLSGSWLPGASPQPFNTFVKFTTPFHYDPAEGDLLVEVRNFTGSTAPPV